MCVGLVPERVRVHVLQAAPSGEVQKLRCGPRERAPDLASAGAGTRSASSLRRLSLARCPTQSDTHQEAFRLRVALVLLSLASVWLLPRPGLAQPSDGDTRAFEAVHARKLASNPVGLSLQIRTETGATSVRMGELVTLVLEFTDHDGSRYDFDDARFVADRVLVSPSALAEDPLFDHRHAIGLGVLGGGLSAIPAPLTGPRERRIDVNETIRFTRPGAYLLYVDSPRFLDRQARQPRGGSVSLTSNLLMLTVRPDRVDDSSLATWHARQLRHADTPAVVVELVRRLAASTESAWQVDTDAWHFARGLYATTHRAAALDATRRELATTRGAVHAEVPRVAAFLETMQRHPRTVPARTPPEPESRDVMLARMRTYRCQLAVYQQQALAAGLRGTPHDVARSAATFALIDVPPDCGIGASPSIARALPPVFHHLPVNQQRTMLASQWGLVAGDAMLPALRALIAEDGTPDDELRDLALVRLGERAPAEAERLSYDDVVTGRFKFSARALRVGGAADGFAAHVAPSLPGHLRDASSPARLYDGHGRHERGVLPLLARFGTENEVDRVLAMLTPLPAACAMRTTIVAYVLRVQPDRGAALLASMLADPASHCGENVPTHLASEWPHLIPEPLMIDALNDPRPRVAASAARALARVGGETARQAIWARLRAWHAVWRGREGELQVNTARVERVASDELFLASELRHALQRAVRWRVTPDEWPQMLALCVTDTCRQEYLPSRAPIDHGPVEVSADEYDGDVRYRVGLLTLVSIDEVVDHLALYPRTSTVAWHAGTSHSPARADALYRALEKAAAERGIEILPHMPPTTFR